MKTVPGALQTHLAGRLTTICYCVVITREDGVVLRFTSLDRDLVFDSQTYKVGYDPTAIANTDQFNVDNLEFAGAIDHDDITSGDIRAGLYDHATFEIFLCNWADTSMGKVTLKTGWLGNISINFPGGFEAEGRSLMQALQVKYGKHFTAPCKWDLGEVFIDRLAGQIGCQVDMGFHEEFEAEEWQPTTSYSLGDIVKSTTSPVRFLRAVQAGTSGASEPDWSIPLPDDSPIDGGTVGGVPTGPGIPLFPGHQNDPYPTDPNPLTRDGTWLTQNGIGITIQSYRESSREFIQINANLTGGGPPYNNCDELDLFLAARADVDSGFGLAKQMLGRAEQGTLAQMTSLRLKVSHQNIITQQGTGCGAVGDYAGGLISIELLADNGQHLHYQVWTFDSSPFPWNGDWFDATLEDNLWAGVNDDVNVYGASLLTAGGAKITYDLDIAARLKSLITNAPVTGLEKDFSQWKIVEVVTGVVIGGHAWLNLKVSDFDLVVTDHVGTRSYFLDPGFVSSNKKNLVAPLVYPIVKDFGELGTVARFSYYQWGISGHLLDGLGTNAHMLNWHWSNVYLDAPPEILYG